MRISKSKIKSVSTRRAHRPDQRVYRSLRLNRIRPRKSLFWLELLIGLVVFAALVLAFKRWL